MDSPQKSRTIIFISLLTLITGLTVMVGWWFNIIALQNIIPVFGPMAFNAALCFVLFSTALLVSQYQPAKYNSLFFILVLLGTSITVITISQDFFNFNSGIDQFFITSHQKVSAAIPFPGRMAFTASLNFTLLGFGLLIFCTKKIRLYSIAQYFFHLTTFISAIIFVGYLYGVALFSKLFYVTSMAGHTAILLIITSVAASLLNPSLGITMLFTGNLVGNKLARRLAALVVIMVVILAPLKGQAQYLNIFPSLDVEMSVLAIFFLLASLLLIWDTTNWLNKAEKERSEAEAKVTMMNIELEKRVEERTIEVRKSEEKYHSLIEQASDAIYILDFNGIFTNVNDSICKMTGYKKEELLGSSIVDILDAEELKQSPFPKITNDFEPMIRERTYKRKDGSAFIAEINVKVFSDNLVMVIARDITDRKKMETELREAELKFRTIADKSMVGVYIVQSGEYTYVNPRFAHIFGYEPEELIHIVPVEIIIHEDFRNITTDHVRRRISGEVESVHYEIMGRKKDGTANWVEFYGSRAIIGGEPTIIGSMIDITERKQAEEELRSSEQKYKLLFESNPMPMWMIAKDDMTIIDVNEAAIKHYGYTREELLNKDVKTMRPPEDFEDQLKGYQQDIDGTLGVVRHLKKDGTMMYMQIIAHDIIFDGRPVRLSLTNDITERLKAEESLQKSETNLQAILKTTDTAYALFDKELRVLAFNQKATEFISKKYGRTIEKDNRFTEYFPPNEFPSVNNFANDVLSGNNVQFEIDYSHQNDSALWYFARMFPITNDNKEVIGMLIALYDITERKNAEQDLKSAYGRIQSHIDSIKNMAWKQSHLIRSPIANLKGLASILKNDTSDIQTLGHIQTELNRLDAIIIEMAQDASNHDND